MRNMGGKFVLSDSLSDSRRGVVRKPEARKGLSNWNTQFSKLGCDTIFSRKVKAGTKKNSMSMLDRNVGSKSRVNSRLLVVSGPNKNLAILGCEACKIVPG